MIFDILKFSDITIIFDKKRVPLSTMERIKRKGIYRYYGAQGVIDYIDDYIFDGKYLLIAEDGENLKSKKQNIAQIAEGKFWVNNHAHIVQCNGKCRIEYLCFLLNSIDLSGYITGSAQPKLSQANLNNIQLRIPPVEIQDLILGQILPLERKIALNTAINENIEQQLLEVYHHLFDESSKFCELGDAINTTSGGTPSRKKDEYYKNGTNCWVKSKELLGTYIVDTEEKITQTALNSSSAKILPKNSVLIAMYGATVGEYGIISKPMACNQAICALIPNDNYPYTYLFMFAKCNKQNLINLAVGSAQQNVSQVLIKQLQICADIEIIHDFHAFAQPLFEQIKSLVIENSRLAMLRDTLLPKLMNGEVDVSEVKI